MHRLSYLVLAVLPFAVGCHRSEPQQTKAAEPTAIAAPVVRVETQRFDATVAVTGSLISNALVDVKAETTGRITKFPKQEGNRVSAGEPVIWVDNENQRLAVRQADSAVKVAEAALARARVAESHSRSELERSRNLVQSGGITDKDLKAAELADQDSRAQTALMSAQLDQARASLEASEKKLRDTTVHAPVAGEIQRKVVNPGAYVEPATVVFSLVDNGKLELQSPVPTSDLAPIRAGQRVTFTVNAYPGTPFEGRVIEINPAVEADTRAARVRIQVDNAGGRLKAGMFAQGEILTGVEAQAVVIPAAAVYRDDHSSKSSFVFVVENGKAARRTVKIGRERNAMLEIIDGLKAGDQLVTEQSIEIAEGVRVNPHSAQR